MYPDSRPELSVIVPCHDSEQFIQERLGVLALELESLDLASELIVVDDGSVDGTAGKVEQLALEGCRLIRCPENRGKFAAITRGVLESRGRCLLFTDADVPFDLGVIPLMVDLVLNQGFHLAVGDRSLSGSIYAERTGPVRRIASRVFTYFVRLFVTSGLYDTQCGIKAMRADVGRLLAPMLREHRFSGDLELLYVALKYNLAIRRVPVRLRFQGPSSLRLVRDGLSMGFAALRLRSRHRRGLYWNPELASLTGLEYPDGKAAKPD
ncbi:MAG: glycosyltransferase [Planctomycetota bacterium]